MPGPASNPFAREVETEKVLFETDRALIELWVAVNNECFKHPRRWKRDHPLMVAARKASEVHNANRNRALGVEAE